MIVKVQQVGVLVAIAALSACWGERTGERAAEALTTIGVPTLLEEMVDLENLARRPVPFFRSAQASSYSRASHDGGDAWFANDDRGHYVRTETNDGRTEHVLADLEGPGTITRFWSANPTIENVTRFYFDGETEPSIETPLSELFTGELHPFDSVFSYVSGTGGNLYYPIPYRSSLKITIEERDEPLSLYYEIGYRSYEADAVVETFDRRRASEWEDVQARVAGSLLDPQPVVAPEESEWMSETATIEPGETFSLPRVRGEKAVYEFSARVLDTRESQVWDDPTRAHNAYRFLVLGISFDRDASVAVPLGDFFGSGPGVNPYENLLFTVDDDGLMTSRLVMPFRRFMDLEITNSGTVPYTVELSLHIGPREWTRRDYHLRAQWGTLTREAWPHFDVTFLSTTGEGKLVGSVYNLANPVLVWWGEGDQKIWIDGEPFPSTFGTGTEDDYGYAYGYNGRFVRPFHAQTRVDGPWSGGHISLNRWYVLDAFPYRSAIRFDQEVWHWMPSRPTWSHVAYWYARPGTPGPRITDPWTLAPVDLGIRENMLDPYEGEGLSFTVSGGTAGTERLANCAGAHHLVWRGADPGDRLVVRFEVPDAGRYSVELNLAMMPDYGRHRVWVNGVAVAEELDSYSAELYWHHPKLGVFDLVQGINTLEVETQEPNPAASPGNLFGLDYVFLIRQ
ncbi:MAG: DUF2961 domain-containing protein [Gemmatimonadota bacterium]|nr:MAG: DUF2961 domain-containing protein [Gemmatimonadota bacterium]